MQTSTSCFSGFRALVPFLLSLCLGVSSLQAQTTNETMTIGSFIIVIDPSADLQIVKSGTTTANANGIVTYNLVVTNNGPSAAGGATISDPAVANFTADTLAISTLSSGGSVTLTITGTAGTSGSIINNADVDPHAGVSDPNLVNNSSSATAQIVPQTALQITKTGPATVNANGTVTYTIVVINNGPTAANC
jgi:uncharacterized repeat protein (TIGR01451 family)